MCQVLTKDSVTVSVDAVVYYRVSNATVSVANVENAHHSTRYIGIGIGEQRVVSELTYSCVSVMR